MGPMALCEGALYGGWVIGCHFAPLFNLAAVASYLSTWAERCCALRRLGLLSLQRYTCLLELGEMPVGDGVSGH